MGLSVCLLAVGALGGDKEGGDEEKPEVNEEGEDPEIAEARREAEERRKEKHRKMEEEREEMRQGIRDKVNPMSYDTTFPFIFVLSYLGHP